MGLKIIFAPLIALSSLLSMVMPAAARADAALAPKCQALQNIDFSAVQDAPTVLTSSTLIPRTADVSDYCKVEGYVAPQVGFEMRLPADTWNGKFLELGNSAWGGKFDGSQCDSYVKRGYACIVFDTGHKGRGDDGAWAAHNLPAQVDFGYRAAHVTALAGKAIIERQYSRAPQHSYFKGCSTGGYEGLVEAQRFPWDFDGILAGSPDMDEAAYALRVLWIHKNVLDLAGQLLFSPNDLALLHAGALGQCDLDDGVKDGIIGNPLHCPFDPAKLVCKSIKNDSCLTQAQVNAAKRIYAGPTTSGGMRTSTRGPLPGSELLWNGFGSPGLLAFVDSFLNHMIYGVSPEWRASQFDFDRDYERFGLALMYTDTNPDLRKFKTAGGKLLVYQGANDLSNVPGAIIDYVETAERTMGGHQPTQEFFRLFLVPGMNHCTGGAGAYAIDYLHYLETWVEERRAPEVMIGSHVSETYLATMPIEWTDTEPPTPETKIMIGPSRLQFPLDTAIPLSFRRPIYPFPYTAVYKGAGDKNVADTFERQSPQASAP